MTLEGLPVHANGVRVIRADGELDVVSVPPLLPGLAELVAGAAGVVLDLTAVSFFDSSGVRLVDRLARVARGAGAGFRVVAPPGTASRRVLEVVGMDPLVDDDVPAAVTAAARLDGGR
jgi:anti-sigma B factor antagonist